MTLLAFFRFYQSLSALMLSISVAEIQDIMICVVIP